jgi:hypothetical protein
MVDRDFLSELERRDEDFIFRISSVKLGGVSRGL